MSKQDRQGVRTAADIERKYDLGKLNALRGQSPKQDIVLNELTQKVDQFIATTNGNIESFNEIIAVINEKIDELNNSQGGGGTQKPKIGTVTLLASAWEGTENLYHQIVAIEGVTENSQVDLTPDVEQLAIFYEKDLSFVTENENGTVTVYAIGQKPLNDYTIQVTITEVDV